MKKTIAWILTAVLLLAAVPALADITPSQVVGTWYVVKAATSATEIFFPLVEQSLEIKRDRSAELKFGDIVNAYTWEISGDSLWLNAPEGAEYESYIGLKFTDDGLLTGYFGDPALATNFDFYLGKEQNLLTLPAETIAAQEEDLFGSYKAVYAVSGTYAQPAEEGYVTLELSFAEAKVSLGKQQVVLLTDFQDGKIITDAGDLPYSGLDEFPNAFIAPTEQEGEIVISFQNAEGEEGLRLFLVK